MSRRRYRVRRTRHRWAVTDELVLVRFIRSKHDTWRQARAEARRLNDTNGQPGAT